MLSFIIEIKKLKKRISLIFVVLLLPLNYSKYTWIYIVIELNRLNVLRGSCLHCLSYIIALNSVTTSNQVLNEIIITNNYWKLTLIITEVTSYKIIITLILAVDLLYNLWKKKHSNLISTVFFRRKNVYSNIIRIIFHSCSCVIQ